MEGEGRSGQGQWRGRCPGRVGAQILGTGVLGEPQEQEEGAKEAAATASDRAGADDTSWWGHLAKEGQTRVVRAVQWNEGPSTPGDSSMRSWAQHLRHSMANPSLRPRTSGG